MKYMVFVSILFILTGCNNEDSRITGLEERIGNLELKVAELQGKIVINEMVQDFDEFAMLKPSDPGYNPVKFDLGYLTISFEGVKAYENGSMAKIKIGNPLSATINGLKANIDWGPVNESGDAIAEKEKSREVMINQELLPGSWNTVNIVLEDTPPSQVGYLRIKNIEHMGVALKK